MNQRFTRFDTVQLIRCHHCPGRRCVQCAGGQVHDSQEAKALPKAMLEAATRLGDKGDDSNAIREAATVKNAWANIPSRSNLAAVKLVCTRIWCAA